MFSFFTNIKFSSFIIPGTKTHSTKLSLSGDLIGKVHLTWKNDLSYKSGFEKLGKALAANDVAERGVKFIQDYNILKKM